MLSKKSLTHIGLVSSMIIWGISFIWTKELFNHGFQPITVVFFRFIFASIILIPYAIFVKKLQILQKKDYKLIIILAFFEPFLYFIGESYALTYLSPTIIAVLIATIPIFGATVGFYFFKEKLSFLNIIGITVSFIGVIMVVLEKDFSLLISPIALFFMVLAVLSAVVATSLIKKISSSYNSISILIYKNLLACIFFMPVFFFIDFKYFDVSLIEIDILYTFFKLVILATCFAPLFFIHSLSKLKLAEAEIFTNLIPVFTAIFSFFILDEYLNFEKYLGILVVIIGLLMMKIKSKK